MKIGIFDSGLGGLLIGKSIRARLPQYDYAYYGDTLHLPYGKRSSEAIYGYTENAMRFLFERENCQLVIVACNTASVAALRTLQQLWLPVHYPDRRILGVVVPMLEAASEAKAARIGLIGTEFTIESGVYEEELRKINPQVDIIPQATPLLVPLLENGGEAWIEPVLSAYLQPVLDKGVDSLILACTHYGLLKPALAEITKNKLKLFSQDDIIPERLADYLARHPEIENRLSRGGTMKLFMTDVTPGYARNAHDLLGETAPIEKAA